MDYYVYGLKKGQKLPLSVLKHYCWHIRNKPFSYTDSYYYCEVVSFTQTSSGSFRTEFHIKHISLGLITREFVNSEKFERFLKDKHPTYIGDQTDETLLLCLRL